MLFRNRKADEQRLDPVDDGQRRIVGLDGRAGENQPGADDAGDRRANLGVVELQACDLDGRLARAQVGLRGGFVGARVVHLFFGNEIAVLECHVARRIGAHLGEQRFVARSAGLCLCQPRGEVRGIEADQQIALLDVLPLGKQQRGNLAIDARLERDAFIGFGPSDDLQADGNVPRHGLGCRYGNRRRFGFSLRTSLAACAKREKACEQEGCANGVQGNTLSSA
jgi:hypothetical protein